MYEQVIELGNFVAKAQDLAVEAKTIDHEFATIIAVADLVKEDSIAAGSPVDIKFLRKDQSPCSETLLIPDLQISDSLPQNTLKTIHLPAMKAGTYNFHCQMQMYRGQIIVQ